MTKSKDGAPHLKGELHKVGSITLDYAGGVIAGDILSFHGYNTESGDPEYLLCTIITDKVDIHDTSDVYDVYSEAGEFTARVVCIHLEW